MMSFVKKNQNFLFLLLLAVIFFSCQLVITWDSTHYLTYVDILEGNRSFAEWDVVRGPIFPLILYFGDFLFGKSDIGILIMMFIFYILYCYLVYKFCSIIFANKKHDKLFSLLLSALCCLNPMILGYYHTILTEFVAITISMLSLYIAWKWWNVENKKEQIAYSLYFITFTVIAYMLKQPYVLTTLVPMIISVIYAIIKNHNIKSILYYIGTFIVTLIILIMSIILWNKYLSYKGLDLNTDRNALNLLPRQVLFAVEGYDDELITNFENIKNDKYLTKNEKEKAKKWLDNGDNVLLLSIYKNKNLLEKDVLNVGNSDFVSTTGSVKEVMFTFVKHPTIVLKSYMKNYCALASICIVDLNQKYAVTNKIDLVNAQENGVIPYRSFRSVSNNFYFPEERISTVQNYIEPLHQSYIANIIEKTTTATSIIYKLVMSLLLIALVTVIIVRIIKRKNIQSYDIYLMSIMFICFALATIFINAIIGSIIDRYAIICFVPSVIGIVTGLIFISSNIVQRKKKGIKRGKYEK